MKKIKEIFNVMDVRYWLTLLYSIITILSGFFIGYYGYKSLLLTFLSVIIFLIIFYYNAIMIFDLLKKDEMH